MIVALGARSVVVAAIGVLILVDAPLPALIAAIVVSSILRGGFEPVAYACVADLARPEQRIAAYGLQRMGVNLGWAFGPALGGLLAAVIPFGTVFFVAAPLLVVSAVAIARLPEPEHHLENGGADGPAPLVRGSKIFLGCVFLFSLCHVQLFSTLSMYATGPLGLSKAEMGLIYTVNGVAVLVLQIPAIAAIARVGTVAAVIIGSCLYTLAFASFAAAAGLAGLMAAVIVFTLGEIATAPAQQTLNAELGQRARMGRAFGIFGLFQMLGMEAAPVVGGAAFDALGSRADGSMWLALAALPASMTLGHALFARVWRPAEPAPYDRRRSSN